MNSTSKSVRYAILRFGLIASLISVALALFNWNVIAPIGFSVSEVFGYLTFVVALLTVPFAIKYQRSANHEQITFREGATIGLGITLIASIFTGIYSALFFVFQKDEFLNWYQSSSTPAEWQEALEHMESMGEYAMAPWFQGLVMFVTVLLFGIIISLVSALIMRRS